MPPSGKRQMSAAEKDTMIAGIERILQGALKDPDPGMSIMRRLSHREYQHTVFDLMGVEFETVHYFPSDASGGQGFDNQSGTLFISPLLLERYYNAADSIVRKAQSEPTVWNPLVENGYRPGLLRRVKNKVWSFFNPDKEVYWEEPVAHAKKVIVPFATKAFRRFLSREEEDKFLDFFSRVYFADWESDQAFDKAMAGVMKSILVSPSFLYRTEVNVPLERPYPVSNFEMATRLSYLLWSSMPDDRLLDVAYREDLQDPKVLRRETIRMMEDPKFLRFSGSFAPQWLGIEEVLYAPVTDQNKFPELTLGLRKAMYEEVVGYFHEVFTESQNLLEFIDSDYAWINEDLASHYGIEGVEGSEFRPVTLKDRSRGGVLGLGAVLTATSMPLRTSPVLRGQWVLNQVLGERVPPPPADVPELEEQGDISGLNLRSLLEIHRDKPECSGCHSKMDPIGFGLENFDAIGRWRTQYDTAEIDPSGTLTDGKSFAGPAELKMILMEDKEKFAKNFSRKLLSYALGRGVQFIDSPTVDELTQTLMDKEFNSQELMLALVTSFPFRYRRSDLAERYKDI